jgi:hypothetical protein
VRPQLGTIKQFVCRRVVFCSFLSREVLCARRERFLDRLSVYAINLIVMQKHSSEFAPNLSSRWKILHVFNVDGVISSNFSV